MLSAAERVHVLLRERGLTVATAESLTGGRLAALLTAVPGASATYVGGVVAYASELKVSILGVSPAIIEEYGVVSAECAEAMASGARALTGASYALSTTGVAGPDRQEGHPPGTAFVGLAGPEGFTRLTLALVGDRETIQDLVCAEALSALADMLMKEETPLR